MSWAIAGLVLVAVALPHVLSLQRARPSAAIAIWLSALTMRALIAAYAVLFLLFYFPATGLFGALTHWCWHAVVPLLTRHLEFSGHRIGDLALILPAGAMLISALYFGLNLVRATYGLRRLLTREAVGTGPGGATILCGSEVIVASAGLGRPRVVISAGALASLDDQELEASLDHERGHIARRHRFLFLLAALMGSLARFLPGTRLATQQLAYHLERDADNYALSRDHDPLALASAICKAIGSPSLGATAHALNANLGLATRLRILADSDQTHKQAPNRAFTAIAAALATLTLALAVLVPVAGADDLSYAARATQAPHCSA
jgi:Zn-dependent protease with chaperone function